MTTKTIASRENTAIVNVATNIIDQGEAIRFTKVANDAEETARRITKTAVRVGARNGVPIKVVNERARKCPRVTWFRMRYVIQEITAITTATPLVMIVASESGITCPGVKYPHTVRTTTSTTAITPSVV